jgi:hypothetical protein
VPVKNRRYSGETTRPTIKYIDKFLPWKSPTIYVDFQDRYRTSPYTDTSHFVTRGRLFIVLRSFDARRMNNSYVAGSDAYVKGDFAITPTGVLMKGSGRAFTVNPSELEWGDIIGRGASSTVMKSRHIPTGTILALKVINMYDKAKREQLMREIHALFDSEVRTDSKKSTLSFFDPRRIVQRMTARLLSLCGRDL